MGSVNVPKHTLEVDEEIVCNKARSARELSCTLSNTLFLLSLLLALSRSTVLVVVVMVVMVVVVQ